MEITIVTLFVDMFDYLKHSILGRATSNNVIKINVVDLREYSKNKHKKCDDTPFGGGAGMLMTAQPIVDCINSLDEHHQAYRIFLTPKGKIFDDKNARNIAFNKKRIILLCGHYEGIDERVIDLVIDECISIGDYILTGGELAAMVVVDALSRFCDGVLGSEESYKEESFANYLLEYPQYTKPQDFCGIKVPDVLISGNHKKIKEWRLNKSIEITKQNRPDLYKQYVDSKNKL